MNAGELNDFDFFQEANLITRAYCELKGFRVPERLQALPPEKVAAMKEKVAREMSQWSAQEVREWKKP